MVHDYEHPWNNPSDSGSVCIAVAVHKPYRMPKDSMYLPLQVGKALHPEIDLGFQTDDTGDNISLLNASYSELTALYWLWKNSDARYKGLAHYRRHFASHYMHFNLGDRFNRIVKHEEINQLLESTDIILPEKGNIISKRCIRITRTHFLVNILMRHVALSKIFPRIICLRLMR